jgi:hypothetical protein
VKTLQARAPDNLTKHLSVLHVGAGKLTHAEYQLNPEFTQTPENARVLISP